MVTTITQQSFSSYKCIYMYCMSESPKLMKRCQIHIHLNMHLVPSLDISLKKNLKKNMQEAM